MPLATLTAMWTHGAAEAEKVDNSVGQTFSFTVWKRVLAGRRCLAVASVAMEKGGNLVDRTNWGASCPAVRELYHSVVFVSVT